MEGDHDLDQAITDFQKQAPNCKYLQLGSFRQLYAAACFGSRPLYSHLPSSRVHEAGRPWTPLVQYRTIRYGTSIVRINHRAYTSSSRI